MTIAPWLTPTNVLGAIEGGARAGLAQRAQSDQSAEAAARLKLSYDSLAQQADMEQQSNAARQQQAMAAMALKKQKEDALTQYRDQRLKLESQQQAENQRNNDRRFSAQDAGVKAAQALKDSQDKAAQGFFKSLSEGKDPMASNLENPGVPPALVHPYLTEHFKNKAAEQLAKHQDAMETQREASRAKAAKEKQDFEREQSAAEGPSLAQMKESLALMGDNEEYADQKKALTAQIIEKTAPKPKDLTLGGTGSLVDWARGPQTPSPDFSMLQAQGVMPPSGGSGFASSSPQSAGKPATPKVVSQADYDALESGQQYVGPDGKIRVKK